MGLDGAPTKRAALVVGGVVGFMLAVCSLSIFSASIRAGRGRGSSRQTKSMVKEAVRNSAHWSTAADQDSNPLLGVMHANFAHAYLNIARTLTSDAEVEEAAQVRLDEFSRSVAQTQRNAVQRLLAQCPSVRPDGITAVQTGWMS